MKRTGLGRGLDALIDTSHVDTNGSSSISEVELSRIFANPNQPRRNFDEEALDELLRYESTGLFLLSHCVRMTMEPI